jgi:hypothetical protein
MVYDFRAAIERVRVELPSLESVHSSQSVIDTAVQSSHLLESNELLDVDSLDQFCD